MTEGDFRSEMSRLIQTFGAKVYGPERVKLIYDEVISIRHLTWKKVVDELIGSCRLPPLLPEIRLKKAEFRERHMRVEKQADSIVTVADEETKLFLSWIMERINGRMSDPHWEQAKHSLKYAFPEKESCCDQGLIFYAVDGYSFVGKCSCALGTHRAESYPSVSEKY